MAVRKLQKFLNNTNLLGISILVIGVFIFLVVAYFSYQKILSPSQEDRIEQNDINAFKKEREINRAEGRVSTQAKKKIYKRQKAISEKEISGLWEGKLKSGKVLLEMEKGVYRFVIIQNKNTHIRYYLNGYYKITNDLIMLHPNSKWGPPKEGNYNYRFLTSAKIPVVAAKYKGKMVWQVPPKEVGIYVPPYHALLNLAENRVIVWSPLE